MTADKNPFELLQIWAIFLYIKKKWHLFYFGITINKMSLQSIALQLNQMKMELPRKKTPLSNVLFLLAFGITIMFCSVL